MIHKFLLYAFDSRTLDCLKPSGLFLLMRENAWYSFFVVVFTLLETAHSHIVSFAVDKTDHLPVD